MVTECGKQQMVKMNNVFLLARVVWSGYVCLRDMGVGGCLIGCVWMLLGKTKLKPKSNRKVTELSGCGV